ncbi:MAG: phosphatase PAP2 family protein [Actinomycetota bacterium]|nr:phosphatase PAP2 family protein [Actinomycetota bacterium]
MSEYTTSATVDTRRSGSTRLLGRLLLGSVAVFGLSTAAASGSVSSLESDTFEVINALSDSLFWPLWPVMQLGNLLVIPALALVALMFRRWRLAAGLAVSGFACWILAKVVKDFVGRGRPGAILDDVILRNSHAGGGGYVSGHAAVVFALATVLHPYLSRRWRVVSWTLAILVSLARVYVGAHLPLDSIGGAALGCGIGLVVLLAMRASGQRLAAPRLPRDR